MKKIICWAALVLALCLPVCALEIAIAASSSAEGSGITAQSPKISTPLSPYCLSGTSIMKAPLTTLIPGAVLMICKAGRSTLPVELIAPATMPSASPVDPESDADKS